MKKFYVYIYRDEGVPIYIGKGHGKRAWFHFKHSNYHLGNRLRKRLEEGIALEPHIIFCHSEQTALLLETALIHSIGRADLGLGPLFNLTDGGDGCSGYRHTREAKLRIAHSNAVRGVGDDTRAAISRSVKIAMQDSRLKDKCGRSNKGRTLSETHRAKMSAATRGKPKSEMTKQRMRDAWALRKKQPTPFIV